MTKKAAIDLLIFDLDGTLIESKWDIADSVNLTLRDLGLPQRSQEEIFGFVGDGVKKLLRLAVGEGDKKLYDEALESQDFGWVTGLEKQAEIEMAAQAFGVDAKTAKRLIKHPFYSYPGGHSFFDLYVDVIDGLHRLGHAHPGQVLCLYTHSSTLRALRIYLDPRPFREAFSEFGEYKEGQDNVVLLTLENGKLSGYSTAVGLIESERVAREAWVAV